MCVSRFRKGLEPKAKLFPVSNFFHEPIFFPEQFSFLTKKMEIEKPKMGLVKKTGRCGMHE